MPISRALEIVAMPLSNSSLQFLSLTELLFVPFFFLLLPLLKDSPLSPPKSLIQASTDSAALLNSSHAKLTAASTFLCLSTPPSARPLSVFVDTDWSGIEDCNAAADRRAWARDDASMLGSFVSNIPESVSLDINDEITPISPLCVEVTRTRDPSSSLVIIARHCLSCNILVRTLWVELKSWPSADPSFQLCRRSSTFLLVSTIRRVDITESDVRPTSSFANRAYMFCPK